MAISFINSATVSAYDLDGTFVVNKPTNTAQGDVMFTMVNTFNGVPPSVPSGWTLVTNQNNATPSLGTYVYWKLAGSSEPSTYSWGLDPGLDLAANIAVHTYRGVDPTNPVGTAAKAVSTTAESLASGNVTISTPGSWLLAVSGCRHSGTAACTCTMASMTERADLTAADTAGSFSRSMATYDSNGTVAVGTASRTAVVTGTTLAHTVILIPVRPELALAETFTDNFDDNSVDAAKWNNGVSPYTGTVSETNGRIQITDVVGGSSRKGLASVVSYDLRGSYVQAQIVSVFSDTTSQIFPIRLSTGSAGGSTWTGIQVLAGNIRVSDSGGVSSYSATYSATNHKFVRIRESGGTVFYDRSADGVSWTNMTSFTTAALGFSVAEVWPSIEHFNGAAVGSSSTAAIDNFNIVPVLNSVSRTDVEGLSDSASTVLQRSRSANDTETLADTVTKALGRNRSASDGEGLSDNLSVAKGFNRSTNDTEGLSDSLTASKGHGVSASDAETLTDALTASRGFGKSASDTVGLADSASLVHGFDRSAADTLGISDETNVAFGYGRSASDALDLADSVGRVAGYSRSATDALSLSDTAVAGLSVSRSTEDAESLSDSLTAAFDRARSAADTVSLSDSVSVAIDHVVTVSDTEALADSATARTGTDLEADEVLNLADAVSRVAEYDREATDLLGLADSLSPALGINDITEDAESLSDAATAALSLPRSAADVVSLSDSVTISIHRNLEVSDSLNLSDQTSIEQKFAELVNDLEELSDSVGWHLSIVVSDVVGLSDSADTAGGTRVLERADTLTLSDSVVAALYRTTVEPLERRASIDEVARLTRTEDIERKWSIGNGS